MYFCSALRRKPIRAEMQLKQINRYVHSKIWIVKAGITSQLSAWFDFAISYIAFQFWGLDSGLSASLGAVSGGIVNCTMNYKWTFKSSDSSPVCVGVKYAMVWIGSLLLNTFGTKFLFVALEGNTLLDLYSVPNNIRFSVARLTVALFVSVIWNLYLQRIFVYRNVSFDNFISGQYQNLLRLIQRPR